jgi:hypothetical protein
MIYGKAAYILLTSVVWSPCINADVKSNIINTQHIIYLLTNRIICSFQNLSCNHFLQLNAMFSDCSIKFKAVLLHAMEALGARGDIAPLQP